MNDPQQTNDNWEPCPPGTLTSLAQVEQIRQRRLFIAKTGGTAGAAALLLGTGWLAFNRNPAPMPGGIACERVKELAPKYIAQSLDVDLVARIDQHVAACEDCRTLIDSLRNATVSRRPASNTHPAPQNRSANSASLPVLRERSRLG